MIIPGYSNTVWCVRIYWNVKKNKNTTENYKQRKEKSVLLSTKERGKKTHLISLSVPLPHFSLLSPLCYYITELSLNVLYTSEYFSEIDFQVVKINKIENIKIMKKINKTKLVPWKINTTDKFLAEFTKKIEELTSMTKIRN